MSQLVLDLPQTLQAKLELQAQQEGVALDEYVLYALTHHAATSFTIRAVPPQEVERQRQEFAALLQRLRHGSWAEIQQALDEREPAEPEPELTPELVGRLKEMIASKRASKGDAL